MQPYSSTAAKPEDKEDNKAAAKPAQETGATATATAVPAEADPTVEPEEGGHDPFEGLDDITKTCFEVCAKLCLCLRFGQSVKFQK